MASDKLVRISQNNWGTLRDLYLINWPTNMIGYYTIDNYMRWTEKLSAIENLFLYSLNGEWTSDGTFALSDGSYLYINTLDESNESLTCLLALLDWSCICFVRTMRAKHRSAVMEILESKNLKRSFAVETSLYFMPKEKCHQLKVSIPSADVSVGNLTATQVEYVNLVWPQGNTSSSLTFLQRISKLNPTVGLTTDTGKLVAWCFRFPSGEIGALQVDEEYKRKGFGSLTIKLMAIQLSRLGHDSFACVLSENIASHELFKKNGFNVIDNIFDMGIQHVEQ